jgi:predicted RNA-binding protein with PUA-like domain
MKAEPESRIEKGKDVKFSIDDLRAAKEPEPWDGASSSSDGNTKWSG